MLFVLFYQEWMAWLFLAGVLVVPLFSLLASLPFMLSARLTASPVQRVTVGTRAQLGLSCKAFAITPKWTCKLQVTNAITGKKHRLRPDAPLPTGSSGGLICKIKRSRVYDFLGLFSLPLRGQKKYLVLVQPVPFPIEDPSQADVDSAFSWKPKKGGFSENHELRLYTEGDSIRQIHWKLSAKTGKLIIREPMVPDHGRVMIRFVLKGNQQELERLLGRCLWLGERLAEQGIPFEVECLTGNGLQHFPGDNITAFRNTMDGILQCPLSKTDTMPETTRLVTRCYEIGGAANEAD